MSLLCKDHVTGTVMAPKINRFWEGYIMGLFHAKFSVSKIIKQCKEHGFAVSRGTVSAVTSRMDKIVVPVRSPTKATRKRAVTKLTPSALGRLRSMCVQENPPTQRQMAKKLKVSSGAINKAIRTRLRLRKFHKARVHKLSKKHEAERRRNCRRLYERHLAADRYKSVVSLDEAWVYLSDCGKVREISYRPQGEKGRSEWVSQCKESFPKGFMVVAGYSHRGKLKLRKIAKNAKVNSQYFQEKVMTPIYLEDVPRLYGRDAKHVRIHMDKASSHTSKSSRTFYAQMERQTGISVIPFEDIPVKSPDASPLDFCGFGLLKQGLGKRRARTVAGLWKVCLETWNAIPLPVLQRSLLQWKLRCPAIVYKHGSHIEHHRWWRHGFS